MLLKVVKRSVELVTTSFELDLWNIMDFEMTLTGTHKRVQMGNVYFEI